MTHPDNDTILRFALETLEPSEQMSVGGHITGCGECADVLAEITGDLGLINGYEPAVPSVTRPAPPLIPVTPVLYSTWFRAAAAIAVILLGGYLATGPGSGSRVTVIPQRFTPPAVVIPPGEFAPCEAVDIVRL